MHAPPAVDELELPACNEAMHGRLHLRGLLTPPTLEEGLLNIREAAIGVGEELADRGGDNGLHIAASNVLGAANVILVNCFGRGEVERQLLPSSSLPSLTCF